MISQKELKRFVEKWDINYKPTYRVPRCASCGKKMYFKMWHVFLKEFGYKREVHLCKECGKKYGLK